MAYSRCIRYTFFNNPIVNALDPMERYFLIGLVCAANDYGKFWVSFTNLRSQIFPTDDIDLGLIEAILAKLSSLDIICFYDKDKLDYGHFPFWRKQKWFLFQRLEHPRIDDIPECPKHASIRR